MDTAENWSNISKAISYYTFFGYEYIDLPWCVDSKYIAATCPYVNHVIDEDKTRCLIGSAEQAFLSVSNSLKFGVRYISCTPCFRTEEIYTETHRSKFMKVEMFSLTSHKVRVNDFISDATKMMQDVFDVKPSRIDTPSGFDLNINNLEVGSYGYREYDSKKWIYGTGIAEPRFSIACARTLV